MVIGVWVQAEAAAPVLLCGGSDVSEEHRDIVLLPTEQRANGRAVWRTDAQHDGKQLWLYFANNAKWRLDSTLTPSDNTCLAHLTEAQSQPELLPPGSVPWQLGSRMRAAGYIQMEGKLIVVTGAAAQAQAKTGGLRLQVAQVKVHCLRVLLVSTYVWR